MTKYKVVILPNTYGGNTDYRLKSGFTWFTYFMVNIDIIIWLSINYIGFYQNMMVYIDQLLSGLKLIAFLNVETHNCVSHLHLIFILILPNTYGSNTDYRLKSGFTWFTHFMVNIGIIIWLSINYIYFYQNMMVYIDQLLSGLKLIAF